MDDPAYCPSLIGKVISQFDDDNGTVFRGCSYYEGLNKAATQVDPAELREKDCKNPDCAALWTEFVSFTSLCPILDQETRHTVSISSLASVCAPTTAKALASTATPSKPTASLSTTNPSSAPTSSSAATIGIVASIVVVLVALVVFGWTRYRRNHPSTTSSSKHSTHTSNDRLDGDTYEPHGTPTHHPNNHSTANSSSNAASLMDSAQQSLMQRSLLDLDMVRVPMDEISYIKPLAEGAYGEVWLGNLYDGPVAIKRLLPSRRTTAVDLQKFISEIVLLSRIECPYVVHLIGAAWTRPSDIVMVTEFMAGGDLRHVLDTNQLDDVAFFPWVKKLQCAHHIAEALVYLDFMTPKVIHRDLKSRNVLLDADFNAKLTDFGIARETDDATMTAGIGTFRWMAPEVLLDGHYTEKADIFSFGVILSELSTNIVPYSDLRNAKGNVYTDTAIMAKVMTGELIPTFASDCPEWFAELGKLCLALDPHARPSATMLAFRFQKAVLAATALPHES